MTIVPSTVMLAAAEAAEAAEFALRATVVNATSAKPRKSWQVMEGHGRSWKVMGCHGFPNHPNHPEVLKQGASM